MFHLNFRHTAMLATVFIIACFIGFGTRQPVSALDNPDIISISGFTVNSNCNYLSFTVSMNARYNTWDHVVWSHYAVYDYGALALYDANDVRITYNVFQASASADLVDYYDVTSMFLGSWASNPPRPFTLKMYDITDQFAQPETGILVDTYSFNPGACIPPLDTDYDTVPDSIDNCPFMWNPSQADADHDNIGDACEMIFVPPKHPVQQAPVVNMDVDSDGVPTDRDNCINEFNPGQEDGWGSAMGDSCDTDWYNRSSVEVEGFVQKDGTFHLHGNCVFFADGASSCPVIADFDPDTFAPADMPKEITSAEANGWSVWVYYLHSNNGVDVYQVNTYRTSVPQPDSLVDDKLEIHISGGVWQWYQRGGDPLYHGI